MEGFQHSRRPLWQQARIGPPGQPATLSREIRAGVLRQPGRDSRSLASGCEAGVQNHFCRETGSTNSGCHNTWCLLCVHYVSWAFTFISPIWSLQNNWAGCSPHFSDEETESQRYLGDRSRVTQLEGVELGSE